MSELAFELRPSVLSMRQMTNCILEVRNLTNDPIFDLRLSLRANDSRLLILNGNRLDFNPIAGMEPVYKEIVLQGQETGAMELLVQDILGKHKRHMTEFPQQNIKVEVVPIPLSEKSKQVKTKKVEFIIKEGISEFTSNHKQVIVDYFSTLFGITPVSFSVLKVQRGNTIISIEMLESAVNLLYEMATKHDPRIINLGIQSILVNGKVIIEFTDIPSRIPDNKTDQICFSTTKNSAPINKVLERSQPHNFPDYLDCWIEIRGSDGKYEVTIRKSNSQAAKKAFQLNPADFAVQRLFTGEITPRDYGENLFCQVFFDPIIYSAYSSIREEADRANKGMRIRLSIDDTELTNLAWELLFDPHPQQNYYICLYKQSPIVRYLSLWANPRPLKTKLPLKILGLAISPTDLPKLQIEKEKWRIEQALQRPIYEGNVNLVWSSARTWPDFQREIRNGDWDVLHFIGHSGFDQNQRGVICFEDQDGNHQPVTAEDFAVPIRDNSSLKLAVLNSCSSAVSTKGNGFPSLAATLVRGGVPAVVAMQAPIIDENAILLAYQFYEALVDGLPIEATLSEARQNLKQAFPDTNFYWAIPVLFMRSEDGKLFDFSS